MKAGNQYDNNNVSYFTVTVVTIKKKYYKIKTNDNMKAINSQFLWKNIFLG